MSGNMTEGHQSHSTDIECYNYPVLNVLYPTPENAALHTLLEQQTCPFGDFKSQKISVLGKQPGRSFSAQQIRIRSTANAKPYSLASVIGALARMLQNTCNKSDEELGSWHLERLVKVSGRKATFLCIFLDHEDAVEPAAVQRPFPEEPLILESVFKADATISHGASISALPWPIEWNEEQWNALELSWRTLGA